MKSFKVDEEIQKIKKGQQEELIVKKKMIIIVVVIVALIAALLLLNNYKNNKKLDSGNPYDKNELYQESIDLIGDELYDNIITPDDLEKKLEKEEDVTVYFFSPTCSYCIQTTPVVVPMTEDLGIDMVKMNLLEYQDEKERYDIEGTPTIVHFKNGEAVDSIVGYNDEEVFEEFFENVVLEK